jgi:hypothetical protein
MEARSARVRSMFAPDARRIPARRLRKGQVNVKTLSDSNPIPRVQPEYGPSTSRVHPESREKPETGFCDFRRFKGAGLPRKTKQNSPGKAGSNTVSANDHSLHIA